VRPSLLNIRTAIYLKRCRLSNGCAHKDRCSIASRNSGTVRFAFWSSVLFTVESLKRYVCVDPCAMETDVNGEWTKFDALFVFVCFRYSFTPSKVIVFKIDRFFNCARVYRDFSCDWFR
jgi:hypothetical protein